MTDTNRRQEEGRERPILFSAPMVRAILSGSKSQTRRIVDLSKAKHPVTGIVPHEDDRSFAGDWDACEISGATHESAEVWNSTRIRCPYGRVGDQLWVRETCRGEELKDGLDGVRYFADDALAPIEDSQAAADAWVVLHNYRGHKGAIVPPIHMPRWASRITLAITDVRVQRLNEISEADAREEGIVFRGAMNAFNGVDGYPYNTARDSFRALWESINGKDSWATNPWVWALTFALAAPGGSEVRK